MIRVVPRKRLNVEKYNDCIANSIQSNVFGFSWYLDEVADRWSVLVLDDYDAVIIVIIHVIFNYNYVKFIIIHTDKKFSGSSND